MLPGGMWRWRLLLLMLTPGLTSVLNAGPEHVATTNSLVESKHPLLWQQWTRDHGLPDNRILAVLQTRSGYLWVATPSGLARFDGRQWEVFNRANVPDLFTSGFRQMVEDVDGVLWVGARNGLFRWNGQTFVRHILNHAGEGIGVLAVSPRGGLWCLAESRLWRLHQGRQESIALSEVGTLDFYCAAETSAGLWLGHSRGLIRYDWRTGKFTSLGQNRSKPFWFVAGLQEDAAGVLWLLHGAGDPYWAWLSRYDFGGWPTNKEIEIHNGARSLSLFRDRENTLWFPNSKGSIGGLRAGRRFALSLPPSSVNDFALAMGEDRDGGLWIATEDTGLLHGQPSKVETLSGLTGGAGSQVWSLCQARDGGIWVGTDHGVSHFYEERVAHYTRAEGLSHNAVRSIVEDQDGRIWLGTGSGLNWIERTGSEGAEVHRYQFPGEWFNTKVRTLLVRRDRELWVGTAKGLHRLQLRRDASTNAFNSSAPEGSLPFVTLASYGSTNGLRSDDIRALWEDRAGRLWVGTSSGGMHRFADGRFYPEAPELSDQSVWAIHEARDGTLWLGTGLGLVRFKDGRVRVLTSREGLPEDVVNHVLTDGRGQLWLGGEQGIHRFSEGELNALADGRTSSVRGVSYDEAEGLPSRETNGQKNQPGAMRTRDGRVWFPTTKGVVLFNPAQLPDQTNPPPVVIEQIRAGGQSLFDNRPGQSQGKIDPAGGEFALEAGARRSLEFHYTACAFVAASKMQFKYRLQGLEEDWTDAGVRHVAQYANLKPGHYRFQVRAGNKYGVWNETSTAVSFTLAPFYWETIWFRTLVVIVPLLAAYGFYWRRILHHRRLAEADRRTAVASERADIARDLHDYLGPRFTLMQHLSESLRAPESVDGADATARQRLTRLAGELHASLDSAVWAVQPDKDTLRSLADYLGDLLQELLAGTNIELELDFPDTVPPWPLSRSERYHLVLVAIEALNNTMKHARATVLQVRLLLEPRSFTLRLADNGSGLPTAAGAKADSRPGRGLVNMRQRLERLGGVLRVLSQPGRGVTVEMTLSPAAFRAGGEGTKNKH